VEPSKEAAGTTSYVGVNIGALTVKVVALKGGEPILTFESDGYAVLPVFLRQVEVHIQQVLDAFDASGQARRGRSEPPRVEAGDTFVQRIPV